jgi:phage minor structural protein
MLEVYDKTFKKLAILQNAFGIQEIEKINAVSEFSFSLPDTDVKIKFCDPFNYIRYNGGDFYRIMPCMAEERETGVVSFQCEHVIALLIDTVMFGLVTLGGLGFGTRNVIEYILDRQLTRHWVLDECDFNRFFEYGFEQENLLRALFSVPGRFVDKYIWKFNTNVYPFRLSLNQVEESAIPSHYIRKGHNRLTLINQSDPRMICTRLYPLGAGEGINQMMICDLNNGIPYLQSPQKYIDKYGIVERVWVDRRYTDTQSLLEAAQVMLDELQEPIAEYETKFIGDCKLGDIVDIVGVQRSYIVEIITTHGEVPDKTIKIANKPKDIAASVADLADRQRIEMAYSQGATQLFHDNKDDNATPTVSLMFKLMIPSAMRFVNAIVADIEIGPFRRPFTVTGGGGSHTVTQMNTTSSAGNIDVTTTQEPQRIQASSQEPQRVQASTQEPQRIQASSQEPTRSETSNNVELGADGAVNRDQPGAFSGVTHNHGITPTGYEHQGFRPDDIMMLLPAGPPPAGQPWVRWVHFETKQIRASGTHSHNPHRHDFIIPQHGHTVTIPQHGHEVTIPQHGHTVTIPQHSHELRHNHNIEHTHQIPNHEHELNAGISFEGNPTGFKIFVNGILRETINSRTFIGDITHLLLDTDNKVPRDVPIRIEIFPNDVAYVQMTSSVQGFIQSRGDRTV